MPFKEKRKTYTINHPGGSSNELEECNRRITATAASLDAALGMDRNARCYHIIECIGVIYMNLVNARVNHSRFGVGKIVSQEDNGLILIQFSPEYGIKRFVYPDAFEAFLELYDSDLAMAVAEDAKAKQMKLDAEESLRQQRREESVAQKSRKRTKSPLPKVKNAAKTKAPATSSKGGSQAV